MLTRGADSATKLAVENPHPRDGRVVFDEGPHVYYVDGERMPESVTGVIAGVETEHFDADAVAASLAARPSAAYNAGQAEDGSLLPLDAETIKAQWTRDSALGTSLHGALERHLNGLPVDAEALAEQGNLEAFRQVLAWLDEKLKQGYRPYRTEWVIFDEKAGVAGSVDFVARHEATGKLLVVDWKRCKHGTPRFFSHWRGARMRAPMDHLSECKLSHWRTQVNLYRVILEDLYGFDVEDMYMVVGYPGQACAAEYNHVRDDAVKALLQARRHAREAAAMVVAPP